MVKNLEWLKKSGEDWYVLSVKGNNYNNLTDDQSLKVQEMFDNKNHQKLQEKFNKMIVILTAFTVLNGIFSFIVVASENININLINWLMVFGIAFLATALIFLYVALPDKIKSILKKIKLDNNMNIAKQILALIIFIAMAYVAFEVTILFGIFFLAGGIYALIMHDAWERPGIPVIWLMGSLISRVALTDMLLPVLRYETLIDVAIGLFAFGLIYLIGYRIKNS